MYIENEGGVRVIGVRQILSIIEFDLWLQGHISDLKTFSFIPLHTKGNHCAKNEHPLPKTKEEFVLWVATR